MMIQNPAAYDQMAPGFHMDRDRRGPIRGFDYLMSRRHREVPINRVTADCTPVTVRVGQEVRTVLSCPVDETALCNVVETVLVDGVLVPTTRQVPCIVTVQVAPNTAKIPATVVLGCAQPPIC